jgi:hypothetical protein
MHVEDDDDDEDEDSEGVLAWQPTTVSDSGVSMPTICPDSSETAVALTASGTLIHTSHR